MRHKYSTPGIVLTRASLGESSAFLTIVTPSVGIVRARAQGIRNPGAKLASALATLSKSDLVLIRGKDGWRIAGAVLDEQWPGRQLSKEARVRAARVVGFLLRLAVEEAPEVPLHTLVEQFIKALHTTSSPEEQEAIELLSVLRILSILGFDAGEIPGFLDDFTAEVLASTQYNRVAYIQRINQGIAASGL